MDIWQSASDSSEYVHTGWLGRYLDAQCNGCDHPTQALEIDDVLSLALKGEKEKGLALTDPAKLFKTSDQRFIRQLGEEHDHPEAAAEYLYKTLSATLSSADYIYRQSKRFKTSQSFPATALGKHLKTIASLILSDINTKVYYVSLGSFDTHVNQQVQQKRLFGELNDAIKPFIAELKHHHRFDDVVLMTFSEFGRRVVQNASGGTDHGTANNMFLIGGGLKQQGLINGLPDLENLDNGDLKFQIDFKSVYATVLRNWLEADDVQILGKSYPRLQFV